MEDSVQYGTPANELPDYTERIQSQLPALQMLIQLGWQYLTPAECAKFRDGRLGSVILDPILTRHIREHCGFEFKGQRHPFTENAVANAVQTLKAFRATGAAHQNEQAYDLICLGSSVPQTVEGDTKSFTIDYIDWKHPENNAYHCTAEFKVERVGLEKHYIPDIVLFVNGIPLVVIECKRSAYTDAKKRPIDMAIGQLANYQQKDGIPQLFLYSQLLLALARDKAEYGTVGTPRKFWSAWKEEGLDDEVRRALDGGRCAVNAVLGNGGNGPSTSLRTGVPPSRKNGCDGAHPSKWDKLLSVPFDACATEFRPVLAKGRSVYEQDRTLYSLCRPERLLELIYKFMLFDNGEKKIARYQQYFAVQDILARVRSPDGGRQAVGAASQDGADGATPSRNGADGAAPSMPRAGGVVWHTQGSGKSLTMVMLAKSLALAPDIPNPRIVLVTDRINLDDQIWGTFRACGLEPEQAGTGSHLVDLLSENKTHVVSTTIHKFGAAAASRRMKMADRNTFVLVDEGHRTNYSDHHLMMKLVLKGACFIAFTGTPLAKSAKKNTFVQFGDLFKPAYTIARAVEDKAVVPLLYEARHVPQPVDRDAVDGWFDKVTLGLSPEQKADLKRKFSSERQLNKAAQKVRMIAWDAGLHYAAAYQGTGMKGQLVAPDKATALLYKKFFDEFGRVSAEVLISAPAVREGEDSDAGPSAQEKVFWQGMMDRFGSEKNYNKQLIAAFKHGEKPEIVIVVDKLLTGFDAPCNTVLYLARNLKDHTLLQAIARVNRLFEGKEYGLILDYSGVIQELDEAIDFYTQLANYDREDLAETVAYIEHQTANLPQLHSDLWELFAEVKGSKDPEVYETHLRDPERRNKFYDRFGMFARALSLALSSTTFLEKTPEKTIAIYRKDLKFFQNLRAAVSIRFQERIDFSEYEPKIRKLIDTHVGAGEVIRLGEPINLFDAGKRREVLEDQGKSVGARADMIASATRRVIEAEMAKDPAFYRRFSKLLEEVLAALQAKRIQALEALEKISDIATKVATHTDEDVPAPLAGKDMARRFFGCVREELASYSTGNPDSAAKVALAVVERIRKHKIRDWRDNQDALNRMRGEIDDIFFEVAKESGINIPLETQDKLIDACIEVAIANAD